MSVSSSRNFIQNAWLKWVSRRLPKSRSTLLNQRRIFILPSRQGGLFLFIALIVFLGGINYANSLILVIAFTMISLFIVSMLHTFANLSGLRITTGRVEGCFAGNDANFEILISKDPDNKRTYHAIQIGWEHLHNLPTQKVDLVEAHSATIWLPLFAPERGYLASPRLRVETRFPLGLLTAWTLVQLNHQCIIYPKLLSSDAKPVSVQENPQGKEQTQGQTDFDGLRGYITGDNPKHIAWKQYARGQGLFTKAFVDHATNQIDLDWNVLGAVDVESRLSILAYWVEELSRSQQRFSLTLPEKKYTEASGEDHRLNCLEALAVYGLEKNSDKHE